MAEEQLDWYRVEEAKAAIMHEFALAVARQGETTIARVAGEDVSTLSKGLRGKENKRPSACALAATYVLDHRLREIAAGQCREVLVPARTLEPDEALRLIFAKAQSSWDRRALQDVAEILSMVKP